MSRLHQAQGVDWEHQPPHSWNGWQRLAARTSGIVTPGNLISLVGAGLVIYGLYLAAHHSVVAGLILILIGRCADILDGLVADYTKTKSPLGEGLDTTVDKVVIFLGLLVLLNAHLIPFVVGIGLLIPNICIALLGIYNWLYKKGLHPLQTGKFATALAWITLLLYILKSQLHSQPITTLVGVVAAVSFGFYLILALISGVQYSRLLYKKSDRS